MVVQDGNVDSAPILAVDWCSMMGQGVGLVAGIDSVAGVASSWAKLHSDPDHRHEVSMRIPSPNRDMADNKIPEYM